jgi:hypothetical protein
MPEIDPQNVRQARKVNDIAGEMRVDQYLTNFSVSYRQDEANFVAGFASTPIPVLNESDKYAIYPAGYFWRDEAEIRPLGGRPVQVGYKVENGTYLAEEWGSSTPSTTGSAATRRAVQPRRGRDDAARIEDDDPRGAHLVPEVLQARRVGLRLRRRRRLHVRSTTRPPSRSRSSTASRTRWRAARARCPTRSCSARTSMRRCARTPISSTA